MQSTPVQYSINVSSSASLRPIQVNWICRKQKISQNMQITISSDEDECETDDDDDVKQDYDGARTETSQYLV